MPVNILGISAFYHDSAAALLCDGRVVAAAQEERFSRVKHDQRFPRAAIASVLKHAGIGVSDVDHVVFYEDPSIKLHRIFSSFAACAPRGAANFIEAMQAQFRQRRAMRLGLRDELGYRGPLHACLHHNSHAASAFFASPFDQAAFLTIDGVGEWDTTTFGVGNGANLRMIRRMRFPHSLGLLYAAFTYFTGFKVNSGEYKVMGLAPYGEPKYADMILDKLVRLHGDGSFRLNMDCFDHVVGTRPITAQFEAVFGRRPRSPESPLTQDDMDIARSIQEVTERIVLRMARHVRDVTGERNLCMSGGVALNCVANGRILREPIFDRIWIQPAAGDAGGALGAALHFWHCTLGRDRAPRHGREYEHGSLLGPEYASEDVKEFLDARGIPYETPPDMVTRVADLIASGSIVGWFSGRMEFGPRALGSRSILGDARSPEMQSTMNLKIKFRESFRPFAPAVLESECARWFDLNEPSPYMLLVAPVHPSRISPPRPGDEAKHGIDKLKVVRSEIPAVTHVDCSARVQTVSAETNPRFAGLLARFFERTGCPVLINTSFNVRGEPIVCTPEDAYRCFMRTNIDYLVIEDCLIDKRLQPPVVGDEDWRQKYQLD
jgi:carbamoyltransferase